MRHGRPRQGGRSVAIATGIGRGPDPKNRVGSLTLGDEIIVLAAVERVELAAAHSGRPRLRPLATIHATIMLESAAPSGAARDSFGPPCEATPHSALPLWALRVAQRPRNGKGRNFGLIQDFAARNRTGGQEIVAPRIAGERQHRCQTTAAFRRESVGRLQSGRQNGVVSQ